MSTIPVYNAIRIISRDETFLNRKIGSSGEVFYNKDSGSLRVYDGQTPGGIGLARSDLDNVDNEIFAAKAAAAGVGTGGGGGNTTVSVGNTLPVSPANGNLWLNTNNGSLYVYVNDGDSQQWIQPATPTPSLDIYATKQYVEDTFDFFVAAEDSSLVRIRSGNTIQIVGGENITTTLDEHGVFTVSSTPAFVLKITGDDSTVRTIQSDNVIQFIGAGGITTASDASGNITITGGGSTGDVTFVGNTIDSGDSSAISFTPAVIMQSDLTIENELLVRNLVTANSVVVENSLTVYDINLQGSFFTQGSGTPEIVSDNEIILNAGTRVEILNSPFKVASFTTAQRDALIAQNGDIIYNSSTNKFQGYENGSWANLI